MNIYVHVYKRVEHVRKCLPLRQGEPRLRTFVKNFPWRCLKERVDVSLRDMVSGHGGDGLMVGLDDVISLFQP